MVANSDYDHEMRQFKVRHAGMTFTEHTYTGTCITDI